MSKAVARQRMHRADAWDGYWRTEQTITAKMRRAVGTNR
jgi:hypothetical protein